MPGAAKVVIGDKQWSVVLATSPWELAAGLGGVASIAPNSGMLFDLGGPRTVEVTTEPMLFDIDIVFVSEDLKVVDIVQDVAPRHVVTEQTPVRYFLEVNAGEANGIEAGDSVEITIVSPGAAPVAEWVPTAAAIAVLGFVAVMVRGAVVAQ